MGFGTGGQWLSFCGAGGTQVLGHVVRALGRKQPEELQMQPAHER